MAVAPAMTTRDMVDLIIIASPCQIFATVWGRTILLQHAALRKSALLYFSGRASVILARRG
jgi:hypothetical protein